MNQEQRVWIAAGLSSIIMVAYLNILGGQAKPGSSTKPGQRQTALISQQIVQQEVNTDYPVFDSDEETITLESSRLLLEVGKSSTTIRTATLKQFTEIETGKPLKFGGAYPIVSVGFSDEPAQWDLVQSSQRSAEWSKARGEHEVSRQLIIDLGEDAPVFTMRLFGSNRAPNPTTPKTIRIIAGWGRSEGVTGNRNNPLEAVFLTEKDGPWQKTHLRYMAPFWKQKTVPRGTVLATLSERYFCQAIKPSHEGHASLIPSADKKGSAASVSIESSVILQPLEEAEYVVTVYLGPRDFFRLREAGFEQAFPLGMLNKIGLALILFLKWIASITHNYGVAVVALSVLVTSVLSPFTLISLRSMKTMQKLQPKIEQIKTKYKGDQQRATQETFALFREHKVSPLSGCLPMLLQLPIFFAIWSAITHVIEFRGAKFLWIKDLSMPDRLATLPMGVDLNLLPIVMAAAMFFQTKLSTSRTAATETNPMAKMMSGPMMSIMFGVMFYGFPSSLVLYWLTNSLSSMAIYRFAKA